MKITGIRELRARSAELLGGDEPERLPTDLRRELAAVLGRHLGRLLEAQGATGAEVAQDFRAHRKRRRAPLDPPVKRGGPRG